jgi:hypothetical protein
MRQYGEVPPWLSTAAAPAVSGASGLGTGGGAGVQTKDGSGFGEIEITTGSNPGSAGSVTLAFGVAPPILFFGSSDAFGALTVTNNDGAHTSINIAWNQQPPPGRKLAIHYEWLVSK